MLERRRSQARWGCQIHHPLSFLTSYTLYLQELNSLLAISSAGFIGAFLFWVLILYISSFHGDTTFLHSQSATVKQCENKATPQKWLILDITKQHLHQQIGPLCCALGLIAEAKFPSFSHNLRNSFDAQPGDWAHSYKSILQVLLLQLLHRCFNRVER